jgi:ABC-type molybdate transport system substrate-binding protein
MVLDWPSETVLAEDKIEQWYQPASNRVLDFHGDPIKANLVVFSDGNHHMALLQSLKAFYHEMPQVDDIFYATTPPYPIVKLLKAGAIVLGNLTISVRPHVFISPPDILNRLKTEGYLKQHQFLAQNWGSVLLISRDNPKQIESIQDLMRNDVRLFISNPETEKTSYFGYRLTLEGMAKRQGLDGEAFRRAVFGKTAVLGQRIHHREAPEAVVAGQADVAIVYYHLALRYTRIFPDQFDTIPLGGTKTVPEPPPENLIGKIHIGLINDGGRWGEQFVVFMKGETVARIYAQHGLQHRRDVRHGAKGD